MNPDLLALPIFNDPSITLSEVSKEEAGDGLRDGTRVSFEMVSDCGEVFGYIKAWHHDDDDYAGFVQFDADGNVTDWKVFNKMTSAPRNH